MGLDATVFRRGHSEESDACQDHEAIYRRLGNITYIAYIRERASQTLAPGSVLLEKVLYSGSHAGDHLALKLISALKADLASLADDPDPDMRTFVMAMSELADVAVREGNPICF